MLGSLGQVGYDSQSIVSLERQVNLYTMSSILLQFGNLLFLSTIKISLSIHINVGLSASSVG